MAVHMMRGGGPGLVWWWLALVAVLVVLLDRTYAEPDSASENLLQTLLQLDRKYSSVARPSVGSGPPAPEPEPEMGRKVQRAINMLHLQHLERLYADKARPRFGKRNKLAMNYGIPSVDYDTQFSSNEQSEWLPSVRR